MSKRNEIVVDWHDDKIVKKTAFELGLCFYYTAK